MRKNYKKTNQKSINDDQSSISVRQKNAIELQKALTLHNSGELQQAEILYRKILRTEPDNSDALHLLGLIAYQVQKYDAAISCMTKAIALNPSAAVYHLNIGNTLKAKGDLTAALKSYEQVLSLQPENADAHYNCGIIFQELDKAEQARNHYLKALTLQPDHARAHNNLGNLLKAEGDVAGALQHFLEAVRLDPDYAYAHNNAGNAFKSMGDRGTALHHYREALRCKPAYADAHFNLGIILKEMRQFKEASGHFRKAIQIQPNYYKAYLNLGLLLQRSWKLEEALRHYRQALHLKPDLEDAYNNIGVILKEQGKLEEAYECFYKALEIKPDFYECRSNLLLNLHYHPSVEHTALFSAHRQWAQQHAPSLKASQSAHSNTPVPDRKLRIGYVSPDLRRHSVAFFIEPILASHNRKDFEVVCYADVAEPDQVTERLRTYADLWRDISGLSHEEVSALVRSDGIDMLVDLSGHTAKNRLPVFALKPAPVQITYLGYPDTTGLPAMDYRITDALTDPCGVAEERHTEKLLRLAGCFLCYRPFEESPDIAPLPVLTNGHITFGSCNALPKMTHEVVDLWSQILQVVEGSRLKLKCGQLGDADTRAHVLNLFSSQGIAPDRIDLRGELPSLAEHLGYYGNIDIALDPFPYNGTTTTCEALWMGVPVITLAGERHSARVGATLLSAVGLEELTAHTHGEYVVKAVQLASDLNRLKVLRAGLRNMLRSSPLTDSRSFTRSLEKKYRQVWEHWCRQKTGQSAGLQTQRVVRKGAAQGPALKKLHMHKKSAHQGWVVFTVSDDPHVDHVGDARDLSLFSSESFTEVCADYVLEHLGHINDLPGVLSEWYRVLRPGGKLVIAFFSLDILCQLLLDRDRLSLHERIHIMETMYGKHPAAQGPNRIGLTSEVLTAFLKAAGFTNVQEKCIDEVNISSVPVTRHVVCEKPAAVHGGHGPSAGNTPYAICEDLLKVS